MERNLSVISFDEEFKTHDNIQETYEKLSKEVECRSHTANIKSVFRNLAFAKEYIENQKLGKDPKYNWK